MMLNSEQRTTQTTATKSSEKIVACIFTSGTLGLASYEEDYDEIKVFQAWDDDRGPMPHQIMKLALVHLTPTVVYVNSSASLALLEALETSVIPGLSAPDIKLEKNSVFQIDYAMSQLEHIEIGSMPESLRKEDHGYWINSRINFDATQQIRALGALLSILKRRDSFYASNGDASEDLNTAEGVLKVQDLSELHLDGYLMLDATALNSLQIFQEDTHPSVLGIGQSKEGFSVFGSLNRCISSGGRRMLQSWFLRPMLNLEMINDRLTAIQLLVTKPDVVSIIRNSLKQVKDIPLILKSLQSYHTRSKVTLYADLKSSIKTILHLAQIMDEISKGSFYQCSEDTIQWSMAWKELMIVKKFESTITEQLMQCGQLICNVINFEDQDGNFMILKGICADLDQLKGSYEELPDHLTRVVEKELQRIPRFLRNTGNRDIWSIVYVPQVGYLIQIVGNPLGVEILDVLEDYEQAFESTADDGSLISYYTGQCTDHLNEQFGDLLHKIQDLESSLCAELTSRIIEHKGHLVKANCIVAELDCLLSLALVASEGNYCCPVVTEENNLMILEGRHPLTETVVDSFIPNDTTLDSEKGNIQLITGPNASGKSSYLKQVALIVFLSHIGSFVPAKECKIGLTDRIFTRVCSIHESKTTRVQQSSFMLDLNQMFTMVKQATPRSLLIIDEFGKGTLTADGVGLLTSVLEYWSKQNPSPRILASTHFTELVTMGLLQDSLQIQFLTMQVVIDQEQHHVILYKLIPGIAASSYGIDCAKLCGIPEQVITRANELLHLKESKTQISSLSLNITQKHKKAIKDCFKLLTEMNETHTTMRLQLKKIAQILLTL